MVHIIVASTNPVKINCIKNAFAKMFPDMEHLVEGVSAPSGVSDQPMSIEETIQGARNRAQYIRQARPEADYYAGIEGGLTTDELGQLIGIAWVVILDQQGRESKASTGTFVLPKIMADDIRSGMEMGVAADKLYGTDNIKHNLGTVGALTDGVIDRTEYYTHAAILALIPFKNASRY